MSNKIPKFLKNIDMNKMLKKAWESFAIQGEIISSLPDILKRLIQVDLHSLVKNYNIKQPDENARVESFFRTFKVEEVYMSEYTTFEDALNSIPYFIEEVYNKKRLHSSLGYMPPEEFEDKFNEERSHQLVLT